MQYLFHFIDKYMINIIIVSGAAIVFLFLVRSFRRTMLIENGQTRFVVEHYDVSSAKLYKRLFLFVIFLMLPALAYVKYRVGTL
jgi:hypothetical protein